MRPKSFRSSRLHQQPTNDRRCSWLELLPPPPPPRRVAGTTRCDVAVIGAGFTGLAAARRLADARPDARIVVVDAHRAGDGASGRSSGFLVDLAGFIAAMPDGHSERFIRLSRAGIAELRRLVREHRIDCDWDDRGFLHAANSEHGLHALAKLQTWLEHYDECYERLDTAGLEAITGTSFYRAGIRLPGSVLVQAGALVRGLAASLPSNAELFENSPVRSIQGDRTVEGGRTVKGGQAIKNRWRIEAGDGTIDADRVIVALNGYAPGLGLLPCRVFPLLTFGSLTRQLSHQEQHTLGGEPEWGILAQDPMGSSVRRTRDQRLLIRNYVHYDRNFRAGKKQRRKARQLHRLALRRRFPALAGIELASTWSGVMGISPNSYPFFGRLAPNLFTTAGFTACGIAMGTISGRLLADLCLGLKSELLTDRLRLPGPSWIPPEPFLSLGLPLVIAQKNASAGAAL